MAAVSKKPPKMPPVNGEAVPPVIPPPSDIQSSFARIRRELAAALIEREDEIDLVLTALICQEHVLLVGPPGTGKSYLLDGIMRWLDAPKFDILLTKFTAPEEVCGPVSLPDLKAGRYKRITTGMLPEAVGAFLDEIFKASSAILNTLLKMLNERVFTNDGVKQPIPLRLCVAASNEWPNDQEGGRELAALFDRFLFRKRVRPIAARSGRNRLLWGDVGIRLSTTLTPAELDAASCEADSLAWSPAAKEALEQIVQDLAKEGIRPSDRRQRKSVSAAQAFAWLAGALEVLPEHLEILAHVLWDDPQEQPDKAAQIVARIANPAGMKINSLLVECEAILAATDPKNLAQATLALTKLREIGNQLGAFKGFVKGDRAREYIWGEMKRIKLAFDDSMPG